MSDRPLNIDNLADRSFRGGELMGERPSGDISADNARGEGRGEANGGQEAHQHQKAGFSLSGGCLGFSAGLAVPQ